MPEPVFDVTSVYPWGGSVRGARVCTGFDRAGWASFRRGAPVPMTSRGRWRGSAAGHGGSAGRERARSGSGACPGRLPGTPRRPGSRGVGATRCLTRPTSPPACHRLLDTGDPARAVIDRSGLPGEGMTGAVRQGWGGPVLANPWKTSTATKTKRASSASRTIQSTTSAGPLVLRGCLRPPRLLTFGGKIGLSGSSI